MELLAILFLVTGLAGAWVCPACGSEASGDFCGSCGLPRVPEGMAFVPACSVTVNGETVHVPAFFVDRDPVTCRDLLDWLGAELHSLDQVTMYLTGQDELIMSGEVFQEDFSGVYFVRYTPWVIYVDETGKVGGVNVQNGCFDLPAAALTFAAADLYLQDTGKRLPTEAELVAAVSGGTVGAEDAWDVMEKYTDFLSLTISSVVGIPPSRLAMFGGNASPEERVMWEWTREPWGGESVTSNSPYALIVKPLDPPVRGTALRENGYFNVIFRGVVPLPWYQ